MKVAVVTGANKGIGFEVAKKLASNNTIKVILACRNQEKGLMAVSQLQSQLPHISPSNFEFRSCDISSPTSIHEFVENLSKAYSSIDILVNNAAIAFKNSDPTPFQQQAEPTIKTNFFGTLYLTKAILPLLRASTTPFPRIVNVASMAGHLRILNKNDKNNAINLERINQFTNPTLTLSQLETLANEFIQDVKSGNHESKGWPNTCYGMSKLLVIAMTKVLARELSSQTNNKMNTNKNQIENNQICSTSVDSTASNTDSTALDKDFNKHIIVTACCPGWCATDMSSHSGPRSAEEGARTPAYLALLPDDQAISTSGLFFRDEQEIEW